MYVDVSETGSIFVRILIVSILLISIVSFALVVVRLCQKGTSQDLRQKVLRRHVTYFLVYLMIVFGDLVDFFGISLLFENKPEIYTDIWDLVMILMFDISGTFLALIRLMEPWVWESFRKEIKGIARWFLNTFCC